MWDSLRKLLAFGLGAAAITGDKLRQAVDEAVERGEMSKEEGRKFIDEVTRRGQEEARNMQERIREQVRKSLQDAGCADVKRVDELEKRVEGLERKLKTARTGRARAKSRTPETG